MTTSIRSFKLIGAALATAFALAAGCDTNHVLGTSDPNIDSSQAGSGASQLAGAGAQAAGGAAGTNAAAGTSGAAGAGGLKAGPLGPSQSWTGYVEQTHFPSGSDQIKLTFATDADGVVAGTVIFGVGTPPPPATDPNVGYPVSAGNNGLAGASGSDLTEGYSYAFDGGTLDTHRLRFTVNLAQLWAGWCALQTPPSDGSSGCLPNWGGGQDSAGRCYLKDPQTGKSTFYDCGKMRLCSPAGPCQCSASGCAFNQMGGGSFDLFVSGDTLSGSADFLPFGNVHFVRD